MKTMIIRWKIWTTFLIDIFLLNNYVNIDLFKKRRNNDNLVN